MQVNEGMGTVYRNSRKEGYWVAQISYTDNLGKLHRPRITNCKSEAEAKRKIVELWKKAEAGGYLSKVVTLENLIVAVIEEKRRTVWYNERMQEPTATYDKALRFLKNFRESHYPMIAKDSQKVMYSDIYKFVADEMIKGVSKINLKEKLNLIKEAFNYSIKINNGQGNNTAALVKVPKKYVGATKPVISYSEDELKRLIPIAKKSFRWHVWALLLYMGVRPGEVMALRWEDIDFENDVITIDKAVDSRNRKIKETKTGYNRTLKILDVLRPILIEAKLKYSAEYAFVAFNTIDKDKPINKQVLYKQWRRICKRVGVDKTAVYGLRHTFATLSEKNGLNKECIAAFMGHKHLTTTEGYIDDYRIRMEQKNISLAASELNSKSFINII